MAHDIPLLQLGKRLMTENYPHLDVTYGEVIQSGEIKTIWKFETSIGTVCLKRIRKSIPIVKFTTAAQAYLSSKGACVAGIIPTKDDQLYFIHEEYALVVYIWIEGSDLEMDEDEAHLSAGLKGLAQFHKDTVGFIPPDDCEVYDRMGVWPDHYAKMFGELTQWKADSANETTAFHKAYLKTVDDMLRIACEAIRLLQNSCYSEWTQSIGKYGYMCHQDYGKGNALQTDHGVYVLDLDNLAYDIPLRDVRKLIIKRMDYLECWDGIELERILGCYESVLPFMEDQRRLLYIDLLFPHQYYGYAKNPFKKGKKGEVKKIVECFDFEMQKLPLLTRLLKIN